MSALATSKRIKGRKKPKTQAAEGIANALVTAAELILAEDGLEGYTTNRVAMRAGVSVGSLYQYFPNKEALLAELARRMEQRTARLMLATLEACRERSLRETIVEVVDLLLSDRLSTGRVRHIVRREVPAAWTASTSRVVDEEVRAAVAEELTRRPDVRKDVSSELLTWISSHAVELLVEQAVLMQPELLESAPFRAQLVEILECYLKRPAAL